MTLVSHMHARWYSNCKYFDKHSRLDYVCHYTLFSIGYFSLWLSFTYICKNFATNNVTWYVNKSCSVLIFMCIYFVVLWLTHIGFFSLKGECHKAERTSLLHRQCTNNGNTTRFMLCAFLGCLIFIHYQNPGNF